MQNMQNMQNQGDRPEWVKLCAEYAVFANAEKNLAAMLARAEELGFELSEAHSKLIDKYFPRRSELTEIVQRRVQQRKDAKSALLDAKTALDAGDADDALRIVRLLVDEGPR